MTGAVEAKPAGVKAEGPQAAIVVENIVKRYGDFEAV